MEGAELVRPRSEDIGVEAIDNYTLRITLKNRPRLSLSGCSLISFFGWCRSNRFEKWGTDWTRRAYVKPAAHSA